jgi:phage terminase large subunit
MLYGGAIRGGKTIVMLAIIFTLCRIYPGSRWAFIREDLPKIKRNLIPTFEKFKPKYFGNINKSDWTVEAKNGSKIIFLPESIKDDPELDKFRGLEVNGFVMEEANECQEKTFNACVERAGTWNIPTLDIQPPSCVLLTCNPSRTWVKSKFYDPWKLGSLAAPFYYLQATADDNPFISEEQKENWKNLPENEYNRFVKGDWDYSDDPDQLIVFEWVNNAINNTEAVFGENYLGVDVARYGDDETVFAYRSGNSLLRLKNYSNLSIPETAAYARKEINDFPVISENVRIDTVGLGAGVADILKADKYNITEIVGGAKPVETGKRTFYTFKNYRSQFYWELRELFKDGLISLSQSYSKLNQDLTNIKYKITADKVVEIESKDDIKKRIGRSTDYGDALAYAFAPVKNRAKEYGVEFALRES